MEEGTIVHVDYELYNNESGDLIETTREDVAKEHEMHQEGRSYSPMVCVVGGGNLIPGFEAALADAKANKEIEVVIEAAEAYGEKDPEQIETISIDKLIRAVKDPNSLYIGAPVNIGNRQGYLSYLAAGRARVDYNHPMAGKTLKYSFKVVKVVEGKEEQVLALLESNTGHSDFGVAFDGDGDRLAVVTGSGRIIRSDVLLMLYAQDVVSRNPGADVVFDVKCSRLLSSLITQHGGRPVLCDQR